MSGVSMRDRTTREEREQIIIERGNKISGNKSKLNEYMSNPNVKKFNSIVTDKSFDRIRMGRPCAFNSKEECLEEVEDYFKLCYECNVIPTIASLALYLGLHRETLYNYANNSKLYDFSNVLKQAIDVCQSYQEGAVLDGSIQAVPFIFLAKNYYGLKDTTDISFNNQQNDTTINSGTMDAIKEQIALEEEQKLLSNTNTKE